MSDHRGSLEERLHAYPRLKTRVEALLAIVEETSPARTTADDAERCVIEELRHLGQELLQEWAVTQEAVHVEACCEQYPGMVGHGKKNCIGTPRLEKSR